MLAPRFRLKPTKWHQSYISSTDKKQEPRSLQLWAQILNPEEFKLIGAITDLDALEMHVSIKKGKAKSEKGEPVEDAVGVVTYTQYEQGESFVGATIFVGDEYDAIWRQVSGGAYTSCEIVLYPIEEEDLAKRLAATRCAWDVKATALLYLEMAAVTFSS